MQPELQERCVDAPYLPGVGVGKRVARVHLIAIQQEPPGLKGSAGVSSQLRPQHGVKATALLASCVQEGQGIQHVHFSVWVRRQADDCHFGDNFAKRNRF